MDSKNDHVRKGWTDEIQQWKRFYRIFTNTHGQALNFKEINLM